jgi:acetyl-CoA/propionyl-CoA carboxylase biotin carboxyl carrier protein
MLRALDETVIDGVATTIPALRVILESEAFIAGRHSTNFVEDELDLSTVVAAAQEGALDEQGRELTTVEAEVDGQRFSVRLWLEPWTTGGAASTSGHRRPAGGIAGVDDGVVRVPMQGTIVQVLVENGQSVHSGDVICVLEAMKMENPIRSPKDGTVTELRVQTGDTLGAGDVVALIS